MEIFLREILNNSFASILLGVISIILSVYVQRLSLQEKRIKEEKVKVAKKVISEAQVNLIDKALADLPDEPKQRYLNYLLLSQRDDGSFPEGLITISTFDSSEMSSKVENEIAPLKARLEKIENRFPKESTIEKIASVNDAVMATQIEHLIEEVKKLDEKILTKWDVAVVVFEIMAVIGVVGGIIIGVIQYLAARVTPLKSSAQ